MFIEIYHNAQLLNRYAIEDYDRFEIEGNWQERAKARIKLQDMLLKDFQTNYMPNWTKNIAGLEFYLVFESKMNRRVKRSIAVVL